jgi:hypothetical protein
MEINYDLIIKYLCKNEKNIFTNKKNILQYSDKFPDLFLNFLQNKFYKYGITIFDQNNINISFFISILTLLNKDFITFTYSEEIESLNKFKSNIKDEFNNKNINETLKIMEIKNILNNINLVIQLICDIFDSTILILDFKNKNFKIAYSDFECNPWKPILLLANYEELWEPIMYDTKKTFSYNNLNIKKILNEGSIEYYNSNLFNKKYILNENIKKYIDEIQETNNVDKIPELFISKIDNEKNEEINKLNKKTKNELIEICKLKNIKINTKMLKKELIDLIINN